MKKKKKRKQKPVEPDTSKCGSCGRIIDNRGGDIRYTARGKAVFLCSSCLE